MVETIRLIESWLMPPGGILLLLLLALLLAPLLRRLSLVLVGLSALLLYLFSTPWLMYQLAGQLEVVPPLKTVPAIHEDRLAAIVVLGGGRYTAAPEYMVSHPEPRYEVAQQPQAGNSPAGGRGGANPGTTATRRIAGWGHGVDVVGRSTLERLRYGAWLHRQSGFPILVTGGSPLGEEVPESALMAESLWRDFGISAVWQENQSINTWEHARLVPPILRARGVSTLLLVTHAAHLPRALQVFRNSPEMEGLEIIPAPTGFTTRGRMDRGLGRWRPSAGALEKNVTLLHEWGGMLWYQIRYAQ